VLIFIERSKHSTLLVRPQISCLDFGIDLGSPVGIEYYDQAPFKFNGKIEGARVEYLGSPAQVQEEKLQTDGPIPAED
jgi:hypothetical protein